MAGFQLMPVETTFWGKYVWTVMQDALVNLIILLYMTQDGSWTTGNDLFPFPQLQHLAQVLQYSWCLIKVDWKNKWINDVTYNLEYSLIQVSFCIFPR